ncbi:TetR/AcrR family transcriptional regulator [Burkholderia pseudomultivorans]|uniref:TetR family transcriptional regulator n=1 Tax=Burkholderia pseudomultivorans TaxID=1207504 RepID=A0A132F560_9BURK|nr:TetR/AcrR family transcriptional regulator [Burkholderia pseudomultivorans]EGC98400.1 TetR family regulatory protein [Burkholderia sp. TJI49]AOI91066.1 TetR family transcriptional regulator [Burkholderia pseudomultivorans]KVC30663.1 TetR family transcriptional regulator [Burkholderia pseudomultivorans]KVC33909.1 TetR family transcriptional regulator [Burkholderia pseudomultivorans]KVC35316.1 TetR family transcriptional regulator [Burkholderia pseudomultivorans]
MSGIEAAKPPARRTRQPVAGATAQEHLLRAAEELFYKEGVRTVGVEAVVERAGVNKMSLYRQFSSKDELILAYLERMDACFFERFDASVAKHPGQPKAQLIQYFVDLAERATQKDYRGCPFVNVAAEFPDATHPARERVARNKAQLMQRLVELCEGAGAREPQALANSLALVIEGIYAASQTYRHGETPIGTAPALVTLLVDAACA